MEKDLLLQHFIHNKLRKMTNKEKIELNYDPETDLLEIFIGEPIPSYYNEIGDDLFEGRDKKANKLTGYKIFNLSKRKQGWMKSIRIPLPAKVKIESLT